MGLKKKKEIEQIRSDIDSYYKEYINQFNRLKSEITVQYKEFMGIQEDIHDIRNHRVEETLNNFYHELSKFSETKRIDAFNFKDDKIFEEPFFKEIEKLEISNKKKPLEIVTISNEHKILFEKSLLDMKNELKFWKIMTEIASAYRAVLKETLYTIENLIFPEFNGIEALLLADGVRECIMEGKDIKTAKPAKINWFKEHLIFFNNASDYYSFVTAIYTQTAIKDFYNEKNETKAKNTLKNIENEEKSRKAELEKHCHFS